MQVIRTERLRKKYGKNMRGYCAALVKRLKPCVGKRVVLVFREPIQARRKIQRHHCIIEALGKQAIAFEPCIRIPREKYVDILQGVAWVTDLEKVEIKDPR